MSGITRKEKLRRYMLRTDCYFIGDNSRKLYHNKSCKEIDSITKENLVPCGTNPEHKGFKPCPACRPVPIVVKKDGKAESQVKTFQRALTSMAERHEMHIKFVGTNAYVSTIAGEWFFNYAADKLVLYHKNADVRFDQQGNRMPGDYHVQKKSFQTPQEVLIYIANHERSVENRKIAAEAVQITSVDLEEDPLKIQLFIGGRQINQDDKIIALFPDGWHEVTVRFREGKWYIATPGYDHYSPVGLFAARSNRVI